MNHTKGEWKIKVGNYPNSYFLESIVQESETEANVKLIEAAPVMLEACKKSTAIGLMLLRDGVIPQSLYDEWFADSEAAIQKAKGE